MPNPTQNAVHVSTPLTNISISRAAANRGKLRARTMFPSVGVMKAADKFYTYNAGDLLRSQAGRRGPSAESAGGDYKVSTDNYSCDNWSVHRDIDDPTRANADPQFNLDAEAAEFCTDQIELAAENEFLTTFFTTGTWDGASSSTDMTGSGTAPASTTSNFLQWDDVASVPIEDIRGEIAAVESKTGFRPNMLGIGPNVWVALQDHPDILDRIKYTTEASVTEALLARLLGLDRVLVLSGVINSAVEQATDSVAFIAGKHALLLYSTPTPGLRTPTAGYSFVWTGSGVPLVGARISRFRLDRNRSDRIEGETWIDFKQVSSDLGAFFTSAVG